MKILAGGALYNNLDYAFAVGHEDGTYQHPPKQPGGGNHAGGPMNLVVPPGIKEIAFQAKAR